MGNQGVRRTRKLCKAQQSSITRSRTPSFQRRIRSLTMRQRLTLLLTCSIRSRRQCRAWLASCCSRVSSWPRGFLVGMRISTWGSVKARKPRSCNNRFPAGKGVGRRVGNGLIMDTAAVGVTEEEDRKQGIDQQDIFYRVVFFLAAITLGLFNRVLGADDTPFRPVMG